MEDQEPLSKPEEAEKNDNDLFKESNFRMGFRSWRPDWLQKFNSMIWFLFVLGLASITQGILVNGIVMVSTQSIEKEFGFTSKMIGIIVAGNDASALMVVGFVSYFGAKKNKPLWMGTGAIITGIGALMFALPKLMIGDYKPVSNYQMGFDLCTPHQNITSALCDKRSSGSSNLGYLVVFVIAQLIMGAGTTPFHTLGPAYIDENVSPRMSPIYLGVWFATTMLGPGLGFMVGGAFLKTFTNVDMPENIELTMKDPRWIGAWWLGFVSLFGSLLLSGSMLLLFPKHMKSGSLKRQKLIKAGELPQEKDIQYTIKGFIKESINILFNKAFVLSVLALTVKALYAVGLAAFLVKLLILKFGVSSHKASMILGAITAPSMVVGIVIGSYIMRKLKVKLAAKTAAKICAIISLISVGNSFIFAIPGCRNTNLAGVMVPYHNRSSTDNLLSMCNSRCSCSKETYLPICGSDGITYQSPCHAGCTVILPPIPPSKFPSFGNCSCFPAMSRKQVPSSTSKMYPVSNSNKTTTINVATRNNLRRNLTKVDMKRMEMKQKMMKSLYNKAVFGKCDRGCKNVYYFAILVIFVITVSFLSGTPHKIMIMRCVPDNQRSFALGMQFLLMRGLSFMPGPIILGAVIDSQCISWGYKCGKKLNCYDYDIDKLSWNIILFGCTTSIVATILYALTWWMYPETECVDKPILTAQEEDENQDL